MATVHSDAERLALIEKLRKEAAEKAEREAHEATTYYETIDNTHAGEHPLVDDIAPNSPIDHLHGAILEKDLPQPKPDPALAKYIGMVSAMSPDERAYIWNLLKSGAPLPPPYDAFGPGQRVGLQVALRGKVTLEVAPNPGIPVDDNQDTYIDPATGRPYADPHIDMSDPAGLSGPAKLPGGEPNASSFTDLILFAGAGLLAMLLLKR